MKIISKPDVNEINMPAVIGSQTLHLQKTSDKPKPSKFELDVFAALLNIFQHPSQFDVSIEETNDTFVIETSIAKLIGTLKLQRFGDLYDRILDSLDSLASINVRYETRSFLINSSLIFFKFNKSTGGKLRIGFFKDIFNTFYKLFTQLDYPAFVSLSQNEKLVFLELIFNSKKQGSNIKQITLSRLLSALSLPASRKNAATLRKILVRLMPLKEVKYINLKRLNKDGTIWYQMN